MRYTASYFVKEESILENNTEGPHRIPEPGLVLECIDRVLAAIELIRLLVWTLINPSDGVMKLQLTDVLVAVTTDVACWYTPPL